MNYYKSKCRFPVQDDRGNFKTETRVSLFNAVSYTDAETRTYANMEGTPEFHVDSITKININELFADDSQPDQWFKAKVNYIVFDEKSQKEKKVPFLFLLNATDVKLAHEILKEKLGTVQDYVIADITTTNIQEVILSEN